MFHNPTEIHHEYPKMVDPTPVEGSFSFAADLSATTEHGCRTCFYSPPDWLVVDQSGCE